MDNLFGLSMTTIMFVLLGIFSICVLAVAYVMIRNPLLFKLGLRNIPRRRAQSILIVVGLALSSLIITASLATGDTIDRSITAAVYQSLGQVDESIDIEVEDEAATRDQLFFSHDVYTQLVERLPEDAPVDGMVPALFETVNAFNPETRLSEPGATLGGFGISSIDDFGGYTTVDGERVFLSDLEDGQAFVNQDLADNLNAQRGSTVTVVAGESSKDLEVASVVENTLLGGDVLGGGPANPVDIVSSDGIVVPLSVAQALVGRPGRITNIFISNEGGVREGAGLSEEVVADVLPILDEINGAVSSEIDDRRSFVPLIEETKQENLNDATEIANIFSTFFVIFGLFSIAAGILLIFLIFVMLAAERRSEMGMARAVGMKRSHLVQQFISEGMAYDVGAAFVGSVLGVGTAFLLVTLMLSVFNVDIPLEYSITPRSMIIALCLAMTLTFLTIFISSLNVSQLNIVSAIQDTPAPSKRRRRRPGEIVMGFVLSLYMVALIAVPIILLIILLSALSGLGFLLLLVLLIASIFIRPIRRVLYRPLGLALGDYRGQVFSVMGLVGGLLLILHGQSADILATFSMGVSLVVICSVFFLSSLTRLPGRALWTTASLILLVYWLSPDDWRSPIFGELDADFEMFFVSGIFIVVASTLFLVYNADLMLGVLKGIGSRFSRYLPAIQMAVVYPLASRLRTGLTLAMFSLIMFAIVMMAIINNSFLEAASSEDALGGWDVLVTTSPNTQIDDLRTGVAEGGGDIGDSEAVGKVTLASLYGTQAIQSSFSGDASPADRQTGVVNLWGGDQEFLDNNRMPLQTIASQYADDDEVWQALSQNPTLAVVDGSAVTGFTNENDGGGVTFRLSGVSSDDSVMEPIDVTVTNPLDGEELKLTVVGVIDETNILAVGIFTSLEAVQPLYGDGDLNQFFIKIAPGAEDEVVAEDVESSLVERGVQAQSLNKILEDLQAQQKGFLYLLEGFMSLGLVVGVASLGVISLRAVVERRQQIGMLRAVGFRGGMVSLAFMLESGFIAFVGLGAGILSAFVLSYNLINSSEISGSSQIRYVIPWGQIMLFAGLAFLASLLMTWFPARAASNVPVAEALRYE